MEQYFVSRCTYRYKIKDEITQLQFHARVGDVREGEQWVNELSGEFAPTSEKWSTEVLKKDNTATHCDALLQVGLTT